MTCLPSTFQAPLASCVAAARQSLFSVSSMRLCRTWASVCTGGAVGTTEGTAATSPLAVAPWFAEAKLGAKVRLIVGLVLARNVLRKRRAPYPGAVAMNS